MRYAVVDTREGFSAFVPDRPGCIAIGGTVEGVTTSIRSHVDGFLTEGGTVPLPGARVALLAPDGGSRGSLSGDARDAFSGGDGPEDDDVYRGL